MTSKNTAKNSHCFSPIKELSATECQTGVNSCDRYYNCGEWLTSELCNSKHNLHCILAVTGSHWSSRRPSVETWSHGFKFNTVCVDWTSGDRQGWRSSSQGRKCESSNQSDSDITSELLLALMKVCDIHQKCCIVDAKCQMCIIQSR